MLWYYEHLIVSSTSGTQLISWAFETRASAISDHLCSILNAQRRNMQMYHSDDCHYYV